MCLTGCGGTDPAHAIRLKVVYGKTKDAHPHAARRYVSANRVRKKIHKNNAKRAASVATRVIFSRRYVEARRSVLRRHRTADATGAETSRSKRSSHSPNTRAHEFRSPV